MRMGTPRQLQPSSPDDKIKVSESSPAQVNKPRKISQSQGPLIFTHTYRLHSWLAKSIGLSLLILLLELFTLLLEAMAEILPSLSPLTGVAVAGFAAQLVDGSLGMGYGITSSSVLVASGTPASLASASVHLAQLGTTAASGLAHFRLGNVDTRTLSLLSLSGMLGAFGGATLLACLPSSATKLVAGALLSSLGLVVLFKFGGGKKPYADTPDDGDQGCTPRVLRLVGLVGGFVDATGGGGWGPVATTSLLAKGHLTPAKVIGTISASEFFVTVSAVAVSLFLRTQQAASRHTSAHLSSPPLLTF